MPFGYKNANNVITVSRITYICTDCSFTTEVKESEEIHYYQLKHYLKSSIGEPELYDIKKHGKLPEWFKKNE